MDIMEYFAGPWKYVAESAMRGVYDANGMYIMFADVNPNDAEYTMKEEQKAILVADAPEMLEVLNGLISTGYYSTEWGNKAISIINKHKHDNKL